MLCMALQQRTRLFTFSFVSRAGRGAAAAVAGAAVFAALAACEPPFNLGQPTTRTLELGVADTLTAATSLWIGGSYKEQSGDSWTIALLIVRPDREEVTVSGAKGKVNAIVIGNSAYFSGQDFLSQHMGADPLSRDLVKAAGNAWWKGSAALAPTLPDFTNGRAFRSTFLASAATQRTDHVSVDGVEAIEMSGPRADVFIRAESPYYILHVRIKKGAFIDGIGEADLKYSNFNRSVDIGAPKDVIDFSNLSTLPPIYTVVSVDTSGCASPCVVSALLKNLGGVTGAKGPSIVTFTMTSAASGQAIGSCQAPVQPDVGFNATTTVSCAITLSGPPANAAIVTATADNPGHA